MASVRTRLAAFLNRPHPSTFETRLALTQAATYGLIIFSILFFLSPFGMSQIPTLPRFWLTLGFGMVTFVLMGGSALLLPRLWPRRFDENQWTMGAEILYSTYMLVIIGAGNAFYFLTTGYPYGNFWSVYASIQLGTVYVGLVPMVLFTLVDQNRALKNRLAEAEKLTRQLPQTSPTQNPDLSRSAIPFANESNKVELQVALQNLLFLKAEGNYVDVYYLTDEGQATRHTLRNRLKVLDEQLTDTDLFPCHRSYRVNLAQVRRVLGNARNYELEIPGVAERVPVSRTQAKALQAQLAERV